jgi:hypothetical protein
MVPRQRGADVDVGAARRARQDGDVEEDVALDEVVVDGAGRGPGLDAVFEAAEDDVVLDVLERVGRGVERTASRPVASVATAVTPPFP